MWPTPISIDSFPPKCEKNYELRLDIEESAHNFFHDFYGEFEWHKCETKSATHVPPEVSAAWLFCAVWGQRFNLPQHPVICAALISAASLVARLLRLMAVLALLLVNHHGHLCELRKQLPIMISLNGSSFIIGLDRHGKLDSISSLGQWKPPTPLVH